MTTTATAAKTTILSSTSSTLTRRRTTRTTKTTATTTKTTTTTTKQQQNHKQQQQQRLVRILLRLAWSGISELSPSSVKKNWPCIARCISRRALLLADTFCELSRAVFPSVLPIGESENEIRTRSENLNSSNCLCQIYCWSRFSSKGKYQVLKDESYREGKNSGGKHKNQKGRGYPRRKRKRTGEHLSFCSESFLLKFQTPFTLKAMNCAVQFWCWNYYTLPIRGLGAVCVWVHQV